MKEFDIGKAVKITEYNLSGGNFNVQIKHWYTKGYDDLGIKGEHHWCLYVVIGHEHPLFEKAIHNECDFDTELGNRLYPNFHCGCTYYNRQSSYVKIGCDYQHLGDEYYWSCEELPSDIEQDAKELFDWFRLRDKE